MAPTEDLPDVLRFMQVLWELDHGLNAASKRMLATMGVTGPQRLVIRVLGRSPGSTPGQLARVLRLHPGTVTRLVARLEESRLVKRADDPVDSRRVLLTLTARGRRVDTERTGTVEAAVEGVLERTPARRLAEARALLDDLARALTPGLRTLDNSPGKD
jgi:DNA-binding MarR family transcriptional regulator